MLFCPASIAARVTERSASASYATSSGPKHSKQACWARNGASVPQLRQIRQRAAVVDIGSPTHLSHAEFRGPELAPIRACCVIAHALGGCRGFIGPVPLPLWMRYSVVRASVAR